MLIRADLVRDPNRPLRFRERPPTPAGGVSTAASNAIYGVPDPEDDGGDPPPVYDAPLIRVPQRATHEMLDDFIVNEAKLTKPRRWPIMTIAEKIAWLNAAVDRTATVPVAGGGGRG